MYQALLQWPDSVGSSSPEDLADALVGHADELAGVADGEAFLAEQLRRLTSRSCYRVGRFVRCCDKVLEALEKLDESGRWGHVDLERADLRFIDVKSIMAMASRALRST